VTLERGRDDCAARVLAHHGRAEQMGQDAVDAARIRRQIGQRAQRGGQVGDGQALGQAVHAGVQHARAGRRGRLQQRGHTGLQHLDVGVHQVVPDAFAAQERVVNPAVRAGADLDRPLRDVSVTPHGITQVGTVTRQAHGAQLRRQRQRLELHALVPAREALVALRRAAPHLHGCVELGQHRRTRVGLEPATDQIRGLPHAAAPQQTRRRYGARRQDDRAARAEGHGGPRGRGSRGRACGRARRPRGRRG
jgi:hypothetical protein